MKKKGYGNSPHPDKDSHKTRENKFGYNKNQSEHQPNYENGIHLRRVTIMKNVEMSI